jgi:hypothetical protein
MPALRKLKQRNCKFESSLGYSKTLFQKNQNNNKKNELIKF